MHDVASLPSVTLVKRSANSLPLGVTTDPLPVIVPPARAGLHAAPSAPSLRTKDSDRSTDHSRRAVHHRRRRGQRIGAARAGRVRDEAAEHLRRRVGRVRRGVRRPA
jgi:hypothetical protein